MTANRVAHMLQALDNAQEALAFTSPWEAARHATPAEQTQILVDVIAIRTRLDKIKEAFDPTTR
jgi:hypothetical protein